MARTTLTNRGRKSFSTSGSMRAGGKEVLPSPRALQKLSGGVLNDRSINDYSKVTPTGLAAPGAEADLFHLGLAGPKIGRR